MTGWPRVVRVSIWPDRDLPVDEAEYLDLKTQGLLLPGYDGTEYDGVIPEPRVPTNKKKTATEEAGADQEGQVP